jgi:hypothetical protein
VFEHGLIFVVGEDDDIDELSLVIGLRIVVGMVNAGEVSCSLFPSVEIGLVVGDTEYLIFSTSPVGEAGLEEGDTESWTLSPISEAARTGRAGDNDSSYVDAIDGMDVAVGTAMGLTRVTRLVKGRAMLNLVLNLQSSAGVWVLDVLATWSFL